MTTQDYYNIVPDEIGKDAYINACPAIDDDVSVSNNDKITYLVTVINSHGDYLEHKLFNSLIEAKQCAKEFDSH